jgi:hypothetical protein
MMEDDLEISNLFGEKYKLVSKSLTWPKESKNAVKIFRFLGLTLYSGGGGGPGRSGISDLTDFLIGHAPLPFWKYQNVSFIKQPSIIIIHHQLGQLCTDPVLVKKHLLNTVLSKNENVKKI